MFVLLITLGCGPNEQAAELSLRLGELEQRADTEEELRQVGALQMQLDLARTNADYDALAFRLDKVETDMASTATAER